MYIWKEIVMSARIIMRMSGSRMGRVALHAITMFRDHKMEWHWNGIARELRGV